MDEHKVFVVQEFHGRAFGHDFAVVKDDHTGGILTIRFNCHRQVRTAL
ncbi:MAG: hypothetical protein KKG09_01900 [Verrucomicrobia bacterium]|nr:hypothetical protein [Verrucomicrobiota bacterium]MBU4248072.1 hypothetical protein [Verrucomicrobiota bacterium]MBU4290228.1 hypothetical protein [Verrucomicrobiota bacterium]MBU4430215.1 hypothetical protein [Verrucomicrobiota bacterium]MBU4496746.1 hypothetical protein [Verrucomicrobiota bacterium]